MIDDAILQTIHARLAAALMPSPLRYRPLIVDDVTLGLIDDARAERLERFRDVFRVAREHVSFTDALCDLETRSKALVDVAHALRSDGALPAWRDERYAAKVAFDAAPMFFIERGAARWFGIRTWAAHINGVVGNGIRARMWIARRSVDKAVDPGLLDNLVGGGISADASVDATLVKEAWEEAGIAADVARNARPCGVVHVRCRVFDGLQRETVFVHDLSLSNHFVPACQDGEAFDHRLIDLFDAARLIASDEEPDAATVDASVVVLDYLIRHGAITPGQPGYEQVAALGRTVP